MKRKNGGPKMKNIYKEEMDQDERRERRGRREREKKKPGPMLRC